MMVVSWRPVNGPRLLAGIALPSLIGGLLRGWDKRQESHTRRQSAHTPRERVDQLDMVWSSAFGPHPRAPTGRRAIEGRQGRPVLGDFRPRHPGRSTGDSMTSDRRTIVRLSGAGAGRDANDGGGGRQW